MIRISSKSAWILAALVAAVPAAVQAQVGLSPDSPRRKPRGRCAVDGARPAGECGSVSFPSPHRRLRSRQFQRSRGSDRWNAADRIGPIPIGGHRR